MLDCIEQAIMGQVKDYFLKCNSSFTPQPFVLLFIPVI